MQMDILEIISVDFDETDQLLFVYSALVKFLEKRGIQQGSAAATYSHEQSL